MRPPAATLASLARALALVALGLDPAAADASPDRPLPRAIEDNSFLIEEAYNQEDGIVQHISNALWFAEPSRDLGFAFTQEWPAGSRRHQISVTVPYLFLDDNTRRGVGDVALNYRLQARLESPRAAFAPRVSLVLPTGDEEEGLGAGSAGVQVNLPYSRRWSAEWVTHANAGAGLTRDVAAPGAPGGEERSLTAYHLGGSVIWLARPGFNVLFEALATSVETFTPSGGTRHERALVVNPGVRFALDRGALQIVPGVGMPVRFDGGERDTGVFLYLSFEHPFGAARRGHRP